MIYSSIYSQTDLNIYDRALKEAIHFLKKTDFASYQEGVYSMEDSNDYYQVLDLETNEIEDNRIEAHEKYIDIQLLVKGKEKIGVIDRSKLNKVKEDHLRERDILFYDEAPGINFIEMKAGDFLVFFPEDAHMPSCALNGKSKIRKVVYKLEYGKLLTK